MRPRRPPLPPVPPARQVVAGARVHVVLKADQPTGRTVAGVVRDVLTRGDHPRGVKVRLVDGRVGRVQAVEEAVSSPSAGVAAAAGVERSGGAAALKPPTATESSAFDSSSAGGRVCDVPPWGVTSGGGAGLGTAQPPPVSQEVGLGAYMKPAKHKASSSKGPMRGTAPIDSHAPTRPAATVQCPVCGDFEGDEAAVAHHVSGHFEG